MIVTSSHVMVFFLIFARFSGMVSFAPFFDMKTILSVGKAALIFWSSLLVVFVIPLPEVLPNNMIAYSMALVTELLVGFIIGFTANIMISAIEFAGALMDTQAGLSSATVLNPASGKNAALLEILMEMLSILLFLAMNGHHMILSAVFESFSVIPIGQPFNFQEGSIFLISLGGELFKIAFQLAAPIILVIFIVDFSFGILNRVAEQVNVFQMGFQVKPLVSILVFLGITPTLFSMVLGLLERVMGYIVKVLGFLGSAS